MKEIISWDEREFENQSWEYLVQDRRGGLVKWQKGMLFLYCRNIYQDLYFLIVTVELFWILRYFADAYE